MGAQERLEALIRAGGVRFSRRDIPAGWPNRPGLKLYGGAANWIVWHETANRKAGTGARNHNQFLIEHRGGDYKVSFHFVVDDREIWQNLPLDEVAWQAGDGYYGEGNRDGVAIELCVNSDGDFRKTVRNAGVLGRALMGSLDLPLSRNKQHNFFSSYGKDCPHFLRLAREAGWRAFVEDLGRQGGGAPPPPAPGPDPDPEQSKARWYPETRKSVGGSILRAYLAGGEVVAFGYPVTAEVREKLTDGQEHIVQYFQRARLEWHPGKTSDVMLGLVGAELLRLRGEEPRRTELTSRDFDEFYERMGGLARLGWPVTPERDERLADGKVYRVQYTERGRLERHSGGVMLGLVGYELARAKGLAA